MVQVPSKSENRASTSHPPALGHLLETPTAAALVAAHGRSRVKEALRAEANERGRVEAASDQEILQGAAGRLAETAPARLRKVINGSGVVIHTNLGRAPLHPDVASRAAELASGYTDLELDLTTGRRGDRQDLLSHLLSDLSGGEAAMVVNNGAAAVLLMLTALCRGREVPVSRGEAIEIGGGFRIPEILRLSGARLVDVGTTNRTRAADYEAATGPRTAAYLRVHPSNFRTTGFVTRPRPEDLAAAAHRHSVLLLEDVGSGLLFPPTGAVASEQRLRASLAAGVDVVACSGDKLLGASQAGVLVGRADLIARMRAHPLARALRPDKMQLLALEGSLLLASDPTRRDEIPVWAMLRARPSALRRRAERWAERLSARGVPAEVVPLRGAVGGGTTPGPELESFGVMLRSPSGAELRQRLLRAPVPVLALERPGGVAVDARTVLMDEDRDLLESLLWATGERTDHG